MLKWEINNPLLNFLPHKFIFKEKEMFFEIKKVEKFIAPDKTEFDTEEDVKNYILKSSFEGQLVLFFKEASAKTFVDKANNSISLSLVISEIMRKKEILFKMLHEILVLENNKLIKQVGKVDIR